MAIKGAKVVIVIYLYCVRGTIQSDLDNGYDDDHNQKAYVFMDNNFPNITYDSQIIDNFLNEDSDERLLDDINVFRSSDTIEGIGVIEEVLDDNDDDSEERYNIGNSAENEIETYITNDATRCLNQETKKDHGHNNSDVICNPRIASAHIPTSGASTNDISTKSKKKSDAVIKTSKDQKGQANKVNEHNVINKTLPANIVIMNTHESTLAKTNFDINRKHEESPIKIDKAYVIVKPENITKDLHSKIATTSFPMNPNSFVNIQEAPSEMGDVTQRPLIPLSNKLYPSVPTTISVSAAHMSMYDDIIANTSENRDKVNYIDSNLNTDVVSNHSSSGSEDYSDVVSNERFAMPSNIIQDNTDATNHKLQHATDNIQNTNDGLDEIINPYKYTTHQLHWTENHTKIERNDEEVFIGKRLSSENDVMDSDETGNGGSDEKESPNMQKPVTDFEGKSGDKHMENMNEKVDTVTDMEDVSGSSNNNESRHGEGDSDDTKTLHSDDTEVEYYTSESKGSSTSIDNGNSDDQDKEYGDIVIRYNSSEIADANTESENQGETIEEDRKQESNSLEDVSSKEDTDETVSSHENYSPKHNDSISPQDDISDMSDLLDEFGPDVKDNFNEQLDDIDTNRETVLSDIPDKKTANEAVFAIVNTNTNNRRHPEFEDSDDSDITAHHDDESEEKEGAGQDDGRLKSGDKKSNNNESRNGEGDSDEIKTPHSKGSSTSIDNGNSDDQDKEYGDIVIIYNNSEMADANTESENQGETIEEDRKQDSNSLEDVSSNEDTDETVSSDISDTKTDDEAVFAIVDANANKGRHPDIKDSDDNDITAHDDESEEEEGADNDEDDGWLKSGEEISPGDDESLLNVNEKDVSNTNDDGMVIPNSGPRAIGEELIVTSGEERIDNLNKFDGGKSDDEIQGIAVSVAQRISRKNFFTGICKGCLLDRGAGYNLHPDDCRKYIQCYREYNKDRAATMACPLGQFWDQGYLTCRPVIDVECGADPCKKDSNQRPNADDANCRAYWTCAGNRSVFHCCPRMQRYSRRLGCIPDMTCVDNCLDDDKEQQNTGLGCPLKRAPDRHFYIQTVLGHGDIVRPCAPGTMFSVLRCSCSLYAENNDGSKHTEMEFVDDCVPEITFDFNDNLLSDSVNKYYQAEFINILKTTNKTASFDGTSMINIWRMANVDFREQLSIDLKYNPRGEYETTQALITNCNGDDEDGPSIAIVLEKHLNEVMLFAQTATGLATIRIPVTEITRDNKAFHRIKLVYNGRKLKGTVDDLSKSATLTGPLQRRPGGLLVGTGSGFSNFIGEMDDITIASCLQREEADDSSQENDSS